MSRRAGCFCHGAVSRSGQNAIVQGKEQGRCSSCALCTSQPPRDSDKHCLYLMETEEHCVYLMQILSHWWDGGPGHARAISSLLMGQSTHPRLLGKWGEFLGPGRWDPEPLRQSVLQTRLSHCLPRPLSFPFAFFFQHNCQMDIDEGHRSFLWVHGPRSK